MTKFDKKQSFFTRFCAAQSLSQSLNAGYAIKSKDLKALGLPEEFKNRFSH